MICPYCDEEVLPGEEDTERRFGAGVHLECGARQIVGSVAHQMQWCSCYKGILEDPPGMTKRQAACAALRLYRKLEAAREWAEAMWPKEES